MPNRIFLTFACPLKWDDLADIDGEVSRRQCEKCQCSVQKVEESNFEQYKAMREAEPNKRHCVAVEKNSPYVSLVDVVKTHMLTRLAPLSFLVKKSIAIAFSSFLMIGSFFSAAPSKAEGIFSSDHSEYFPAPVYILRMGESGPPVDTDYISRELYQHLLVKQMLKKDLDIWQSKEATAFAKNYERGIISKGEVLAFANLLKKEGLIQQSTAFYALYLTFSDPEKRIAYRDIDFADRSKRNSELRKGNKKEHPNKLDKIITEAILSGKFADFVTSLNFPADVECIALSRKTHSKDEQLKKALKLVQSKYLEADSTYTPDTCIKALAILSKEEKGPGELDFCERKVFESLERMLDLGFAKNSPYERKSLCLLSALPLVQELYSPWLYSSKKIFLANKLQQIIMPMQLEVTARQDEPTMIALVEIFDATKGFVSQRAGETLTPEWLEARRSIEEKSVAKNAKELASGLVPMGKYYASDPSQPSKRQFLRNDYLSLLQLSKERRQEDQATESLKYIKAAGQLRGENKGKEELFPLDKLLTEITAVRPLVKRQEQELLDYWTEKYKAI